MHAMTTPCPDVLTAALHARSGQQGSFAWSRPTWSRWLGPAAGQDLISRVPDRLDRQGVCTVVQDALTDGRVVDAFVPAMIWGYGNLGVGAFRTASILTASPSPQTAQLDDQVVSRLAHSSDLARTGDAVGAYRYLNNDGKIAGLGPSFFTKWIYFASARGDRAAGAPILDDLVIGWLHARAGLTLRRAYTDDYELYVRTLTAWGAPAGMSAVEVEETIFQIIRGELKT